jgi:hypothetical protein
MVTAKDMEDKHLQYAHRLVCNQLVDIDDFEAFGNSVVGPRGEMARADYKTALDCAYENQTTLLYWRDQFEQELKRRHLQILRHKKHQKMPQLDHRNIDRGMGKCIIDDCNKWACVSFPLVSGEPRFCADHYKQEYVGKYGCEF